MASNSVNQQNFQEKAKEAVYALRKKGILEGAILHEALKFYELKLHALELRIQAKSGPPYDGKAKPRDIF